jgi:hypothetical protein
LKEKKILQIYFIHSKYTLDDLYNFVNKVLKDGFNVEKSKLFRRDVEPSGILVSKK